jgi:uncharacterized protein with beta-barrel porin domain
VRIHPALLAATAFLLPAPALAQSMDTNNAFTGALADRLRDNAFISPSVDAPAVISGPVGGGISGGTSFVSPQTGGFRAWGKTFAFQANVGADATSPAWGTRGAGVAAGIEKFIMPNWLVGAAVGYTASDTADIANVALHINTRTVSGAIYSSYALNGFEFNGLVGINGNDFSDRRILPVFGAPTVFGGGTHGLGYSAYGDAGYRFQIPTAVGAGYVKPFAGLNYSALARDAATERSASGLEFSFPSQTFERLSSLAGVDFGVTIPGSVVSFRPEFRLAYLHDYINPAPLIHATLVGQPFPTKDPEPGRDALIVAAQITAWRVQNVQLFAGYTGEFRSNSEAHQAQAGARVSW